MSSVQGRWSAYGNPGLLAVVDVQTMWYAVVSKAKEVKGRNRMEEGGEKAVSKSLFSEGVVVRRVQMDIIDLYLEDVTGRTKSDLFQIRRIKYPFILETKYEVLNVRFDPPDNIIDTELGQAILKWVKNVVWKEKPNGETYEISGIESFGLVLERSDLTGTYHQRTGLRPRPSQSEIATGS